MSFHLCSALYLFFKTVKAKKKKGEGKATKDGSLSKKSKSGSVGEAGGDKGSDSDSSLDVEKWKKLVLQMTGQGSYLLQKSVSKLSHLKR